MSVPRQTKSSKIRTAAYLLAGRIEDETISGKTPFPVLSEDEKIVMAEARTGFKMEPNYHNIMREAAGMINSEVLYCPKCRAKMKKTRGKGGGWACPTHGHVLGTGAKIRDVPAGERPAE